MSRGQRLRVEYINDLPADGDFPVTAVVAPDGTQNRPGRDMDMMRPFVVVTAGAMAAMGMEPPKKNLRTPMQGMKM